MKIIFILLILLVTPLASAQWQMVEDTVYINGSRGYIGITPAIANNEPIDINLISYTSGNNLDCALGFNLSNAVPRNPRVLSNLREYYTCEGEASFNNSHFFCEITNSTHIDYVFTHKYDGGNIQDKTAWWYYEGYKSYTNFQKINNFEYDGLNLWYLVENIPFEINQERNLRFNIQNTGSGKYGFGCWDSSLTPQQAKTQGTLWYIDPWYGNGSSSLNNELLAYYSFNNDTVSGTNILDIEGGGRKRNKKRYQFPRTGRTRFC